MTLLSANSPRTVKNDDGPLNWAAACGAQAICGFHSERGAPDSSLLVGRLATYSVVAFIA